MKSAWYEAQARTAESKHRSEQAEFARRESEWASHQARQIRRQGSRSAREARIVNGEVLPDADLQLRDTLSEPGLAAVEASMTRGRLLVSNEVVALGLDVANSAEVRSTPEKLLAHQLALAHKHAFEQAAQASKEQDPALEMKRLNTSARMMAVYQDGLLALLRLRTGGKQTVLVQHVHVESGAQAMIGSVSSSAPNAPSSGAGASRAVRPQFRTS